MALEKQPCFHCGDSIESSADICDSCGSRNPFKYHCPSCAKEIEKGLMICPECGRHLFVLCPTCKQLTFVAERCEKCGEGLMVVCRNRRCKELQFFENEKCTACGKTIKAK